MSNFASLKAFLLESSDPVPQPDLLAACISLNSSYEFHCQRNGKVVTNQVGEAPFIQIDEDVTNYFFSEIHYRLGSAFIPLFPVDRTSDRTRRGISLNASFEADEESARRDSFDLKLAAQIETLYPDFARTIRDRVWVNSVFDARADDIPCDYPEYDVEHEASDSESEDLEAQCETDILGTAAAMAVNGTKSAVKTATKSAHPSKPKKKTPVRKGKVNPAAAAGSNPPRARPLPPGNYVEVGPGSTIQMLGDATIFRDSKTKWIITSPSDLSLWPKSTEKLGTRLIPLGQPVHPRNTAAQHAVLDMQLEELLGPIKSKRPRNRRVNMQADDESVIADRTVSTKVFPDGSLMVEINQRETLRLMVNPVFPMHGFVFELADGVLTAKKDDRTVAVTFDTGFARTVFPERSELTADSDDFVERQGFRVWRRSELRIGRDALLIAGHPLVKNAQALTFDGVTFQPCEPILCTSNILYDTGSTVNFAPLDTLATHRLVHPVKIGMTANRATEWTSNYNALIISNTRKFVKSCNADVFICQMLHNKKTVFDISVRHQPMLFHMQAKINRIMGTSGLPSQVAFEADEESRNVHTHAVEAFTNVTFRRSTDVEFEASDDEVQEEAENDPILKVGQGKGFFPKSLSKLDPDDQGLAATVIAPGAMVKGMKALPLGAQRVAATQSMINFDSIKAIEGLGGVSHFGVMSTTNLRTQVAIIAPPPSGNYIVNVQSLTNNGIALDSGFDIGCAAEGQAADTWTKSTLVGDPLIITPYLCAGTTKDATGIKSPAVVYSASGTPVAAIPGYQEASGSLVGIPVDSGDKIRAFASFIRETGGTGVLTISAEFDFIDTAGVISTVVVSGAAYSTTVIGCPFFGSATPPASAAALLRVRFLASATVAAATFMCIKTSITVTVPSGALFNKSVPYGNWACTPSKTYQTVVQNSDQPTHKYACQGSALLISNTSNLLNVSGNAISAVLPPGSPEYYGVSPITIGSTIGSQSAPFADGAYIVLDNTPQNVIQGITHNIQEKIQWDGPIGIYLATVPTTTVPLTIRVVSSSFWMVVTSLQMLKPKNLALNFDEIEELVGMFKSGDMISTNKSHLARIRAQMQNLYRNTLRREAAKRKRALRAQNLLLGTRF